MKKIYILFVMLSLVSVNINAASKIVNHAIKSGDTLYSIAHKYHTTVKELKDLNKIKKSQSIKAGNMLKVVADDSLLKKKNHISKSVKVLKIKNKIYAVKKGDTLFTIAKRYHMTVAQLVKINHIKYKSTLRLGQRMKVISHSYVAVAKKIVVKKRKNQYKTKIIKVVRKGKKSNRIIRVASQREKSSLASNRLKRHQENNFFTAPVSNIVFTGDMSSRTKATKITSLAKKKLGRRYVWGATGKKNTFDCSGLTTYVYKKNGIRLPRRAIAQSRVGKRVSRHNLKKGDLVFFDTSKRRKGYVNHVGIYIGNGKFIHASSAKKKVVITSLNKPFYAQRFKGGRRLASS